MCVSFEVERVDRDLSRFISLNRQYLPANSFDVAQSAWSTYRHASCTFESDQYQGGTFQGVAYGNCYLDLSTKRLAELRRYVAELRSR
jgi:uncharacterized protein YecT (DUF1311 family)